MTCTRNFSCCWQTRGDFKFVWICFDLRKKLASQSFHLHVSLLKHLFLRFCSVSPVRFSCIQSFEFLSSHWAYRCVNNERLEEVKFIPLPPARGVQRCSGMELSPSNIGCQHPHQSAPVQAATAATSVVVRFPLYIHRWPSNCHRRQ